MKENKKHKKDPHQEDPVEQVEQQETPTTDEEMAAPEPKGEEESKVDDLLDKYAELQDSYLRLRAEFDNYKKRTLREKSDLMKYGAERTVVTMLDVLDDFDRAVESMDQAADVDAVKEGVLLVRISLSAPSAPRACMRWRYRASTLIPSCMRLSP